MKDEIILANNIRTFRNMCDMTQEELAKKLSITKATVSKYESGQVTNIPLSKIRQLAEIFGISVRTLFGWE